MRDKGLQTRVVMEAFKEDTNLTQELKFDIHKHTCPHPHIQMLNSKILKHLITYERGLKRIHIYITLVFDFCVCMQ